MNPWQLEREYGRGVDDGRSGRTPWFHHEVGTAMYWVYLEGFKEGRALPKLRVGVSREGAR